MIITALVLISLLCQVVFVSILIPLNLARIARHETTAQSGQAESQQAFSRRYFFVNCVIATLGLASLWICASLYHADAISVTTLLLSIGIVFLIQVSPLAILFYYGLLPIKQTPNGIGDLESATGVPGLFKILPLVPVLIAGGLYLVYVSTVGVLWIRTGGNQIPKIVSITATNLICILAVLSSYRRLAKETDERQDRYVELLRMGPVIIFGSILVTTYFFAKEVLFAFDLHEARPIMMSAALQLVAMAVFYTLCGGASKRSMA